MALVATCPTTTHPAKMAEFRINRPNGSAVSAIAKFSGWGRAGRSGGG